MTINQRVFELFSEQGRRQAELARALKISERNVSTWKERGTDPPAKYAVGIAEFFGVNLVWLLTGEGVKTAVKVKGESEGEVEILRVYRLLGARDRHRLLGAAYEIEDKSKNGG